MATCLVRNNPSVILANEFFKGNIEQTTSLFDRANGVQESNLTDPKKIVKAMNEEVKKQNVRINGRRVKSLMRMSRHLNKYVLSQGTKVDISPAEGVRPVVIQETKYDKVAFQNEMKKLATSIFENLKHRIKIDPRVYMDFDIHTTLEGKDLVTVSFNFASSDKDLESKFNYKDEVTVNEMLDNLSDKAIKGMANLAKVLRENTGEIGNIKVKLVTQDVIAERCVVKPHKGEVINGFYEPNENVIYINKNGYYYRNNGNFDNVIMHEIVHAIIGNKTRTADQTEKLKHIFNNVRQAFYKKYNATNDEELIKNYLASNKNGNKDDLYGLRNEDEFVSEIMTNGMFLNLVNWLSHDDYGDFSNNRQISLWDRIIEWIANLLGIKNQLKGSAKDAFFLINDIIIYGGNTIQKNAVVRSSVKYPSTWSASTIDTFKNNVLPNITDMPDGEVQQRINEMDIPSSMQSSLEERVDDWKNDANINDAKLKVTTSLVADYPSRTVDNAKWSDVTLSLATDYDTEGEKLTEKAAGDKYIRLPLNGPLKDIDINKLLEEWNRRGLPRENVKLNIAGNGLYTLKGKYTQEELNNFLQDVLAALNENYYHIAEVRSGGQSGIDEAGVIAAMRLGIPASLHVPANWMYKDENGKTIVGEEAFMARFKAETDNISFTPNSNYDVMQNSYYTSIMSRGIQPSKSTTVNEFLKNGISETFGFKEENVNPANKKMMLELYPEKVYINAVRREFQRQNQLTDYELDELYDDIAYSLYSQFTSLLNDDGGREEMRILFPTIFNDAMIHEIERISELPSEEQMFALANAIGTNNIMDIVRHNILTNTNCPPAMMEKLQIFSLGNRYSKDFMTFLMLGANDSINDMLGFTFNTTLKKEKPKDNEEAESEAYRTDEDEYEDDRGDVASVQQTEDEQQEDDEPDLDEDIARNDFIKKDSLLKSFVDNIEKPLRSALQNIPRPGKVNSFGNGTVYQWRDISNPLGNIIYNAENSDEALKLIDDSMLPFKDELLEIVKSDPYLKTLLFCNFSKNRVKYVGATLADDGNKRSLTYGRTLSDQNFVNITDSITAIAESKDKRSLFTLVTDSTGDAATSSLRVNESGVAAFRDALRNILDDKKNSAPATDDSTLRYFNNDIIDSILYCLDCLGLGNRVDGSMLRNFFLDYKRMTDKSGANIVYLDLKRYNTMRNLLGEIFKSVTNGDYRYDRPLVATANGMMASEIGFESNLLSVSKIIDAIAGKPIDSHVKSGGNSYSTMVNTNYFGRTLDKLSYNPARGGWARARDFIRSEYVVSSMPFFEQLFMKESANRTTVGWKPKSWLSEILYGDNPDIRLMDSRTLTTFNGKKFQEMSTLERTAFAMMAFDWDKSGKLADYMTPVMGDKSRMMVVTNRKYSNPQIIVNMYKVMEQELARMVGLVERAKDPYTQRIANIDIKLDSGKVVPMSNGMQFFFLPLLNSKLSEINNDDLCNEDPVAGWMHDVVYGDGKYNDKYDIKTVQKELASLIDENLRNEVTFFWNLLEKEGALDELAKTFSFNASEPDEKFANFVYNNYFAKTQMIEIFTGDPLFYKNANDLTKRLAEWISDGMSQDSAAMLRDGHEVYEHADDMEGEDKHVNYMVIDDIKRPFRNFDDFIKLHQKRRDQDIAKVNAQKISSKKKADLIRRINNVYNEKVKIYKDIDTTDGQGFMSFKGYDSMSHALGRGADMDKIYEEYSVLYDEFADLFSDDLSYYDHSATDRDSNGDTWYDRVGKLYEKIIAFNQKNKMHFEVVKPFVFTQIIRDGMKIPIQIKNSRFPLLDIQSMMEDAMPLVSGETIIRDGDSSLAHLAAFMHLNDVDVAVFPSNIKVGTVNVCKYNFETLYSDLNSKFGLENKDNRSRWILKIPVKDDMLQQNTPNHSEDFSQPLGAQIQNFLFAPVSPDTKLRDKVYYVSKGNGVVEEKYSKELSAEEMRKDYEQRMTNRIIRHSQELFDRFGLSEASPIVRNSKLSDIIKHTLAISGGLNYDSEYRFSINDNGDFNIPLGEPVSRKAVDKIFTSAIKKAALEIPMPGGQLVQVTDGFRFSKESGTSVMGSKALRIAYRDAKGNITYDVSKAVAVAYYEAEMPYYMKSMFRNKGMLDERLSRLVMYRIPTEGACSIFPVKVVKWSNKISGGIVKLPAELPGIGGMDFDIDKLFFVAPSVNVEYTRHKDPATGKTFRRLKHITYVDDDYAKKHGEKFQDKADCNRILEIFWSVLTSPENMQSMFIPSNFADVRHNKNVIEALKSREYLSDEDKVKRYDELQGMEDREISVDEDKFHSPAFCGLAYQTNVANVTATSKAMLGICANANSQHAYLQGQDISLFCSNLSDTSPCSINGNEFGAINVFDPVMAKDNFTKVYENITQFLTASADSTKEPTLHQLNINLFTINFVVAAARSGMDIETIALILQQPVFYMLVQRYNKKVFLANKDEYIDTDKIIDEVFEEYVAPKGKDYSTRRKNLMKAIRAENIHITKEDLIKNIGKRLVNMKPQSKEDIEAGANTVLRREQFELLKVLYGLLHAKQDILNSNRPMKINVASSRHGSDQFEQADYLYSIATHKDIENSVVTGLPDLAHDDKNKIWQYRIASYNYQDYMTDEFWKLIDPHMKDFIYRLNDGFKTLSSKPTPNRSKNPNLRTSNIYSDWMLYHFVNAQFGTNNFSFGEHAAKGYMPSHDALVKFFNEDFPSYVTKVREILLKKGHDNNMFLKKLEVRTNRYGTILSIPGKSISGIESHRVRSGLNALLHDNDKAVSNFAMQLLMYDFITSGFRITNDSYWQYMPSETIARLDNYLSFWRSVQMGLHHIDEFQMFELIYTLNNLDLVKQSGKDNEGSVLRAFRNSKKPVASRGKINDGTHITKDAYGVYAFDVEEEVPRSIAPAGTLSDITGVYKHRTFNTDSFAAIYNNIVSFNDMREYFMKMIEAEGAYYVINLGGQETTIYDISAIKDDAKIMEIIKSPQFASARELNPSIASNPANARDYLNTFSKFCK